MWTLLPIKWSFLDISIFKSFVCIPTLSSPHTSSQSRHLLVFHSLCPEVSSQTLLGMYIMTREGLGESCFGAVRWVRGREESECWRSRLVFSLEGTGSVAVDIQWLHLSGCNSPKIWGQGKDLSAAGMMACLALAQGAPEIMLLWMFQNGGRGPAGPYGSSKFPGEVHG